MSKKRTIFPCEGDKGSPPLHLILGTLYQKWKEKLFEAPSIIFGGILYFQKYLEDLQGKKLLDGKPCYPATKKDGNLPSAGGPSYIRCTNNFIVVEEPICEMLSCVCHYYKTLVLFHIQVGKMSLPPMS